MSDEAEIRDEFAEQLSDESVPVSAMEVEDSIQAELSSEASSVTADTDTPALEISIIIYLIGADTLNRGQNVL